MESIETIYNFLEKTQGIKRSNLNSESDLCFDLGIEGDDFFELEEAFEKEFKVNMASYKWYFHHAEEGLFNLGGLFFNPPYARVKHIPVTPSLLLKAVNEGSWPIQYPEHTLPSKRYDVIISQTIIIALLGLITYAIFA